MIVAHQEYNIGTVNSINIGIDTDYLTQSFCLIFFHRGGRKFLTASAYYAFSWVHFCKWLVNPGNTTKWIYVVVFGANLVFGRHICFLLPAVVSDIRI